MSIIGDVGFREPLSGVPTKFAGKWCMLRPICPKLVLIGRLSSTAAGVRVREEVLLRS